jgi:hypothetical protein
MGDTSKSSLRLFDGMSRDEAQDNEDARPDSNFLAQFRPPMTEEQLAEAAKDFERAIAAWLAEMEQGDP